LSQAHAAVKKSNTDLYRTPMPMIVPLVSELQKTRRKTILDPCEGDGRIREALSRIHRSNTVTGIDLYYDEWDGIDFLTYHVPHDIIAGNPPFSLKNDFIDHALGLARDVIFLLSMNTVSYNEFHRRFLDIPEYRGRILMTPKVIMNEQGTFKRGGTAAYAWFFWRNGNRTKDSWERYVDVSQLHKEENPC